MIIKTSPKINGIRSDQQSLLVECVSCKTQKEIKKGSYLGNIKRNNGVYSCQSCSGKRKWIDQEFIEKQFELRNEEYRQKMSDIISEKFENDFEYKNKVFKSRQEVEYKLNAKEKMEKVWENEEYRTKMLNILQDPENIKFRTEALLKTISTIEHVAFRSETSKNALNSQDFRNKMKEIWESKEYSNKCSTATKKIWNDPKCRERKKEIWESQEFKNKMSEMSRLLWDDPKYRDRKKEIWESQEFKEKCKKPWENCEFKEKMQILWNSPEFKEKHINSVKKSFENHEYRKKHKLEFHRDNLREIYARS